MLIGEQIFNEVVGTNYDRLITDGQFNISVEDSKIMEQQFDGYGYNYRVVPAISNGTYDPYITLVYSFNDYSITLRALREGYLKIIGGYVIKHHQEVNDEIIGFIDKSLFIKIVKHMHRLKII